MTEVARWLDGNALAGQLEELFGIEMTRAPRRCQCCGAVRPIGAHRLYRGAGLVLRCPVCGDVALCVGTLRDRYIVLLEGRWQMEMPHHDYEPAR